MKVFALFVAAVLLLWASLTYARLRTTRRGMQAGHVWLLPKVAAGTFSLIWLAGRKLHAPSPGA